MLYAQIVLVEQFIAILDKETELKNRYEKAKRIGGKSFDDWDTIDWELHHSLTFVFMHYDKKLESLKQQMFPHRRHKSLTKE